MSEEEVVARQEFCRRVLDELGSHAANLDVIAFGFDEDYYSADFSKEDKNVTVHVHRDEVYAGRWEELAPELWRKEIEEELL